jgi:hypothetical protein
MPKANLPDDVNEKLKEKYMYLVKQGLPNILVCELAIW